MSQSPSLSRPQTFDHVVIVGVGLIGGSIAKALRKRGLAHRITGLGRNAERLAAAQSAGVLDAWTTSAQDLPPYSLAVVCTPVDRIAADVRALATCASATALFTDAGSVKGPLCRTLADIPRFIGSHPMAGSEHGGWEFARTDLFEGRNCAITPCHSSNQDIAVIETFWQSIGMQTLRFSAEEHDRLVATTSHLPHLVAAALAAQLTPEGWPLAATGFRDTTRIASGNPGLWTAILRENRVAVTSQIHSIIGQLQQFELALQGDQADKLQAILNQGKEARDAWLPPT